jgi:hypothetical protein
MRKVLLGLLASATMASAWVASISPVSAQQAAPQQGGPASGSVSVPIVHLGSTPPLTSLSGSSSRAPRESPSQARDRLRPRIGAGGHPRVVEPPIADPPTSPRDVRVSSRDRGVLRSWEGLNSFDTAWADNGNAFFVEPPDQGLCVGGKYVLETVNDVMQVYTSKGRALLPGNSGIPGAEPVGLSLNEFYGYEPVLTFPDGPFGPFITDPSCYYDPALRRWFHVVLTIEQAPYSGDFTGENSLDIAVSRTKDPTGRWDIYRIAAENDGTNGTPDHDCDARFCIGDYPHIGADKYGFYITTNEYSFFGTGFSGSQLYAIPKADLAHRDADRATLLENLRVPELGQRAFTVRPAWARPSSWDTHRRGTEYLVSSTAGDGSETGNMTGRSDDMVVWALTNTKSLRSTPDVTLHQDVVHTLEYALPARSLQKDGPTPLLRCVNLGVDCFGEDLGHQNGPYPLDSGDTRVMSSFMADGVLWTSLDTALTGRGAATYDTTDGSFDPIRQRAGVAYFAFEPSWSGSTLNGGLLQDGYVSVRRANLIYPSLAVTEDNEGYLGVTLVGPRHYPSAAYIPLRLGSEPKVVRIAAAGRAPSDGFTGTVLGGFRPRWGDYGYMVPGKGDTLWFGAEYVRAHCGFQRWVADPNCGDSRTLFTNWTTQVTQLR